jgi:dihydroneopterin aldolase
MIEGDRIEVRQIKVSGHHGALEGEQDHAQPFEVDLDLYLDLGHAEISDDLSMTVDYGRITLQVVEIVATTHYALLEALAGAIANAVLSDKRVDRVVVTVKKMQPPLPVELGSTGVRLVRDNER